MRWGRGAVVGRLRRLARARSRGPVRAVRPLIASIVAAALILTACASPAIGTPAASPTLNLLASFPTSLDPAQDSGGAGMFLDSIFSGLERYNADGDLVPDLAQQVTVSADRTVYTFVLRPHATFHNGDPVTARDVVYSINRACDPAHGSPVAGDYLGDLQGVTERRTGQATSVSGVVAVNPSTVRFTLTQPDNAFLAKLTFPITDVLDQRTVDAGGANWWQHPNGSGPYRLTEWQPQSEATLERYAGYYGPAPQVAKVVLHVPTAIDDPSSAYTQGKLAMLPMPPTAQDMAAFLSPQASVPPTIRQAFHVFDLPSLEYLVLNRDAPPFDDVNVRRALNLAIDKGLLVTSALGGDGWPAGDILPPEFPGYERDLTAYPFDVAAAKAAFAASRYAGTPPTITLVSGERLANGQPGPMTSTLAAMIQQNLGWHVTVTYLDDSAITAALAKRQAPGNVVLTGWQADYTDPSDFLDLLFHSGRSTNLAYYNNPTVDQLLDRAEQAADPRQSIDLYQQAQAAIMRDAPIVPLFYERDFVLLDPHVTSLPLLPDGSFDLRDATMG
jgi:oligopeptide transport system substrate-binding protein